MKSINGKVGVIRDSSLGKKRIYHKAKSIALYDKNHASTFGRLQDMVAFLGYHNPGLEIFVRGQKKDYQHSDGSSAIKATLYRSSDQQDFLTKIAELESKENQLIDCLNNESNFPGQTSLLLHSEARQALLQHYQICPTPFLDITRNTRVAATFATDGITSDDSPCIYVFGLPYAHGNITKTYTENMTILNLRNTLGYYAKRPHEQEGYLMGSLYDWKDFSNSDYHEGKQRLICKIKLTIDPEKPEKFWGRYSAYPMDILMPNEQEDKMLSWLIEKGIKTLPTPAS